MTDTASPVTTLTQCVNPPSRVTVIGVHQHAELLASDSHLSGFSVQTWVGCLSNGSFALLHATKGLKQHQRAEKAITSPGLAQMISNTGSTAESKVTGKKQEGNILCSSKLFFSHQNKAVNHRTDPCE